jgi:heat shock protein HtpX
MHRLQSIALLTGIIALFAFIGYSVFGWTGVLLILTGSAIFNIVSISSSTRIILSLHHARWLSFYEAPEIHRMAEELAFRANIPVPKLAVYPSDMPNAFALGTKGGIVALSTGLIHALDRRELKGVMAHEFAHLKNRDSLLSLSAGLFVQAIASISSFFGIFLLLMFFSGTWNDMPATFLPVMLLVSISPNIAYFLQTALSRTREYLADRDGALLSGDPQGLASALYKLEHINQYLSRLQRRFRFIYTTDAQTGPKWLRTHPPTEDRIRALSQLAQRTKPYPQQIHRPTRYIAIQ